MGKESKCRAEETPVGEDERVREAVDTRHMDGNWFPAYKYSIFEIPASQRELSSHKCSPLHAVQCIRNVQFYTASVPSACFVVGGSRSLTEPTTTIYFDRQEGDMSRVH